MVQRNRCARREPIRRYMTSSLRVGGFALVAWLLAVQCALAGDRQATIDENLLRFRLNNLESQAVQRRGRAPTIADLLNRQSDKRAGQALNELKTRDVRNRNIPLFEGKLRRSRGSARRFER